MKRVRTPYGTRCQRADGRFVKCSGGRRSKSTRRRRGTSGGPCRTKAGRFAKCRKGMKRA